MKKLSMTAAVVGMVLYGSVSVAEEANVNHTESLKGPTIGALTGGLLAGPPGLMVGLIGGVLFGHIEGQNSQIRQASDELSDAQQQIEILSAQQAGQQARILQQMQTGRTHLDAMAEGFSFCLRFRTESAAIEPAIQPHLDALAGMLNAFTELDIEVRASADRRGSNAYNQDLTRLRAAAVVQQLIKAGVSEDRIRTQVTGEKAALYPENDPEGLSFDRYVVISFLPGGRS